ncbi:MAG: tyrosine-type recombinase/integrase [Patescibacteria group bacterium]
MSIFKRGNKYWISIRHNKQRYRLSSPAHTLAGAKAYEASLRGKLALGQPLADMPKESINFSLFADKWFNTYVITNNKPSEQLNKRTAIKNHLKPFFGKMDIDKITSLNIEEFKAKKQAEGKCNKSINNYLGMLGKCLNCAEEWDLIDKAPRIKPLKVPPQKFRFFTEEKYNQILEEAKKIDEEFYEMILFTLRTGVRVGELKALKWEDIDFKNKNVPIKRSIVNGIIGSPKSNKIRTIPLAQDILEVLKAKKQTPNYSELFNPQKSRFSLNRALNRICKKLNFGVSSWHDLRHTFASKLSNNGVPLQVIQALLGHSDLKMTQRYAHLEPLTLSDAIKTLEPKEPLSFNFGHNVDTVAKIPPLSEVKNIPINSNFTLNIK